MSFVEVELRSVLVRDADTVAVHRFPEARDGGDLQLARLRAGYAAWLEQRIDEGRYVGWLAETQGKVVSGAGAVLLEWGATWVDPNPIKARLVNVFTEAGSRRLGLAAKVVSQTLWTLRQRGIHSVSLASTEAGQSLYTKLGFKVRSGELGLTIT